ncbi:SpaA isopeptide-forming pilin-related protein [Salimicrobium flavidum]|uniref:LPXTG-motif cell wall anchor domain-containing protein n=1 Tax=Salimicrobium flavidum TaxID=570947 RepID=A0A1N7KTL9_9BACI|nr:SpaA isopeptide-forming pilin-related protein [Salimicrobium flavidum]SIS64905.1 LPXTG-motif cell wall anchor domain-containing protein [Salimicrobium flavidum]
MKRTLSLLMLLLLLFQTSVSGMIPALQTEASTTKVFDQVTYLDKKGGVVPSGQEEEASQMKVSWSVNSEDIDISEVFTYKVPTNVAITTRTTGTLTASGIEVGTYDTGDGSMVSIQFQEALADQPKAGGEFTIPLTPKPKEEDSVTEQSTSSSGEEEMTASEADSSKTETSSEQEETTETTEETKNGGTDDTSTADDDQQSETSKTTESAETTTEEKDTSEEKTTKEESTSVDQTTNTDENTTKDENVEESEDATKTKESDQTSEKDTEETSSDETTEETKTTTSEDQAQEQKNEEKSTASTESQETSIQPMDLQPMATANEAGEITENILTNANLVIRNQQGDSIDSAGSDSLISIEYDWALPNGHGYKDGDFFTFQVPQELDIYNEVKEEPIRYNNQTIGHFSVDTNGTTTITFTEFIENYSEIEGSLEIVTKLKEETVMTEDKEVIVTPIEGQQSVAIPIDFNPGGAATTKKGVPDRSYNAESIEWTVDFNKSLTQLDNAVLSDPVQSGQVLRDGSIQLYHLNTKLDGSVTLGSQVATSKYSVGTTEGGGDFTIEFNESINTAYRLVYTTDITDDSQTDFDNTATLLSGGTEQGSASASVYVERGKALEKDAIGYDRATQTITWEIRYNYNEKTIPQSEAILSDSFTTSQEFVNDSLNVEQMVIDENGNATSQAAAENYSVTNDAANSSFDLQFNEDISDAYKITYKTKASERVFGSETITNTVKSGEEASSANRNIGQQILFKNHNTPNYENKTVEWEIPFNRDRQTMENLTLTDTFTNSGLTLREDTINISGLEKGTDYELIRNEADEFEINFTTTITEAHTLTYITDFNYEERADKGKNYLRNHVNLAWTNADDESKTKEATEDFKPDTFTQANGFKNGSYNAVDKEITWNIGVNYNLKTLDSAVVTDVIQGNQKLMPDSIKVYKMNLTGGSNGTNQGDLVPESEYTFTYSEEDKEFELIFDNSISSPYKITYKTSLEGLALVESSYTNEAVLTDGEVEETSLDASVSIPHGGKYTAKGGTQNGKIIDWNVNINFGQSDVSNAKVIDNPSANQATLQDSFHLYDTTVDSNGNVTKQNELERDTDYTLTFGEDGNSFTLAFTDSIDGPYILEYQSRILEQVGGEVSNDITFQGENIEEQTSESQKTVTVKYTAGMGDGKGEIGRLTVEKIDSLTKEPLSGAVFKLKDPGSGVIIDEKTTEEDGTVIFDRLLYGDYTLIEERAPEGYVKDTEIQTVTIDSPYEEGNPERDGNSVQVTNKEIKRDVKLTKKDAEQADTLLEGAVFDLQKEDGTVVESSLTTDENGEITVTDLEPGNYQFVETKAPEGYQLDQTPYSFSIEGQQTDVDQVTATNVQLGDLILTKTAKEDGSKRLQGAEFELRDGKGEVIETSLTTDENGEILVEDLTPGTYELVETKAPIHYQLDETPVSFTLEKGSSATVSKTMENELIPGNVELTKVDAFDSDIVLEGAEFRLETAGGDVLEQGLTTDENGKIAVEDLQPGDYRFIETKAPEHYVPDDTPVAFTIEKSATPSDVETVSVEKQNDLISGGINVLKVDEDDSDLTLEGATFDLLDEDENTLRTDLATDENGTLIIDDLRPGTYHLKETEAPTYYALDETLQTFVIEKSQQERTSLTVENELITGNVSLTKKDVDEPSDLLEGAEFKIEKENGETVREGLITDENGTVTADELKPGDYRFVETEAPVHYQLNDTPVEFTIPRAETEEDVVTVETEAFNELFQGDIKLTKVDSRSHSKKLEGAVFNLLNDKGEVIREGLMTDEEGVVMAENLRPGDYRLVETDAPVHYLLNRTPIDVTVPRVESDEAAPVEVRAENRLIPGDVELTKVDKQDGTNLLEGAVFEVQTSYGTPVRTNLVTDETGTIEVNNLRPGTYQFVETKAPKYYKLDETPIEFTIRKSQNQEVRLTAENEQIEGQVELTKVDEDNQDKTLSGAEFTLRNASGETLEEGLTTNDEGNLYVYDLEPGTYEFVETKAPEFYELNETPLEFTVEQTETPEEIQFVEVTAENEMITTSVNLTKVDEEDTDLRLDGAVFTLLDEEGEVVEEGLETDEEGKIVVENLKPGAYSFIETKAPEGYVLDETPQEFTIAEGQREEEEVTVKNERYREDITIIKADADTDEALEGAVFQLENEAGDVIDSDIVTDEDGQAVIEDLPIGVYSLIETESPEGYQQKDEPVTIEVDPATEENGKVIVTNEKEETPEETPDPDEPSEDVDSENDSSGDDPNNDTDVKDENDTSGNDNDDTSGNDNGDSSGGDTLPQTGEQWFLFSMILGILSVIAGGVLMFGRVRTA